MVKVIKTVKGDKKMRISSEGWVVVKAVREMVFVDARQFGVSVGEGADYLRILGDAMDPEVAGEEYVMLGEVFTLEELEGLKEAMGFAEIGGHVKVLLDLGYLVEG